jgi:hypothetical protein
MHAAAAARHMRADVGRGRQGLQCVVVVGAGGFAADQWKVVAVGRFSWVQPGICKRTRRVGLTLTVPKQEPKGLTRSQRRSCWTKAGLGRKRYMTSSL